jgi:hypothetical protein
VRRWEFIWYVKLGDSGYRDKVKLIRLNGASLVTQSMHHFLTLRKNSYSVVKRCIFCVNKVTALSVIFLYSDANYWCYAIVSKDNNIIITKLGDSGYRDKVKLIVLNAASLITQSKHHFLTLCKNSYFVVKHCIFCV